MKDISEAEERHVGVFARGKMQRSTKALDGFVGISCINRKLRFLGNIGTKARFAFHHNQFFIQNETQGLVSISNSTI